MAKITIAGIAELAGTTKQCAWNWKGRYIDFPPMIGYTKAENGRTVEQFDLKAAVAWLQKHGKIPLQDGTLAVSASGRPALNKPSEPPVIEFDSAPPAIDNELAARFIAGQIGNPRPARKNTRPAPTVTVHIEGIWPCPTL
jgi:hypothetical protein